MTKRLEMYKCDICGNLIEVILEGPGELVCCGQPMSHLHAKKNDIGLEKHIPVFEKMGEHSLKIRVGSQPHPMTDEHYIMFIETISKDGRESHLKYLYPSELPEMIIDTSSDKFLAREYCNLHGLWEGIND